MGNLKQQFDVATAWTSGSAMLTSRRLSRHALARWRARRQRKRLRRFKAVSSHPRCDISLSVLIRDPKAEALDTHFCSKGVEANPDQISRPFPRNRTDTAAELDIGALMDRVGF